MWKKDILFKWNSIWITGYCERTTNGGTVSLKMQLKLKTDLQANKKSKYDSWNMNIKTDNHHI